VVLLPADTKRIVEKGYREDEFSDNGFLRKKDGYCVFLGKDLKCTIYDERPSYCRSFPLYFEEEGIDVDLSCPGVGQGEEMRVEAHKLPRAPEIDLEILKKMPGYVSREEFTKKGREWCDSLPDDASMSQVTDFSIAQCRRYGKRFPQDEAFNDFFRIANGRGVHFSREGNLIRYEFELGDTTLKINDCVYQPGEDSSRVFPGEKEQAIVVDYLRTWFERAIFYRFCLLTSAMLHSPLAAAFAFVAVLTRKISMVRDALSDYWMQQESSADGEVILREAIRVLDGRLRTKCQSAHAECSLVNR
jgi:Fe-S-cluster containining protein